jgi:ABC-type uncharacterized transport system permease subunit
MVQIDISTLGLFLVSSLNAMVPIALASLGEIFTEKAGVVNIGLEGIMLTSSWTGFYVSWFSLNPYLGLFAGMVTGSLFGLVHGIISVYLKGDQVISGVGINIFGAGFVPFATLAVFGVGSTTEPVNPATIQTPWGQLRYLVIGAFVLAGLFWYLLSRTKLGIHVTAVGENPEAADSAGLNVERTRLFATIVGSTFAGLAGSYMSTDLLGQITKDITAGRGFIALATVVFSGWNPLFALAGSLIFGFSQGASIWVSIIPSVRRTIPYVDDFLGMLPYAVTLIVVAAIGKKSRVPKALGIPYRRE